MGRASAIRKIGCVQHDCAACKRLMKLARSLTSFARKRGDTDPDYWKAVEAIEAELIRREALIPRARKKPRPPHSAGGSDG